MPPEIPGNPGILRSTAVQHPAVTLTPEHPRRSMSADNLESNIATTSCEELYPKSVARVVQTAGHELRTDIFDNDACKHPRLALQRWHDLVVSLDGQDFSRTLLDSPAHLGRSYQGQRLARIEAQARKSSAKLAAIREAWKVDYLLLFAIFGTHCTSANLLDTLAKLADALPLSNALTLLLAQRKTRRSGGAKTSGVPHATHTPP
ncbi:hypothetical protein LTR17_026664 [Elasticomyces elasticus]|nr:hypothetical protein LTR17_026664 [Elasticomyces elasticus]